MTDAPARLRVGLTGGIASGKSTVAALFAARGVPVIDLDQVARDVVAPGEPGHAAVLAAFGPEVLDAAGSLDRATMRRRVFADPALRRRLEELLHPLILAAAETRSRQTGGPWQVLVVPLLVEAAQTDWVDRVLVVDAPPEVQLARLLARDADGEVTARAILAAQADRATRLAAADDVIVNDGPVEALGEAVAVLAAAYADMAASGDYDRPGIRLPSS
jgi:dephospho-CoA kinase